MSQNGNAAGGLLELGKGLPTTLARGINPAFTTYDLDAIFHLETGMPISEFRERFEGVEKRLDTIASAIEKNADGARERHDGLHDVIFGGKSYDGIMARLQSLEGDRDQAKQKAAALKATVVSLRIGVVLALIPIAWEIVKYLIVLK